MSLYPRIRLGDLCEKITDGTHHSPTNLPQGSFKYITAKNIKPWGLDLTDLSYVDERTHREIYARCDVKKGDILYIKDGATTGVAAINTLEEEFSLLSSVGVLRPGPAIRPKYLLYVLQEPETKSKMMDGIAGVAITRLTLRKLNDAEVPVAPLAIQDRIVEKLEELLSDLDAGVAELKAAQKKIAQYRQSLLKAAVEGSLTADWRAKNPPAESGAQLLQRILTERRARWEAKQLAKFNEQGKTPPKDWQKKYPEPVQPESADLPELPELPEGWVWATVDCLLSGIETGKSFKCVERPPTADETGVVKVSAVSWGEYDEQESKTCTDEERVSPELMVKSGDFLFSRANTVELVGACVIAKKVSLNVMLSDKILRLVLVLDELKPWLLYLLRSKIGRRQIELLATGNQESMKNIGQERLRSIAIPLGPKGELDYAIALVEQELTSASQQISANEFGLKQATAQRQNILRAAFSGQLVPQDPNDEPASVLLARIRAEQAAAAVPKHPRTRLHTRELA